MHLDEVARVIGGAVDRPMAPLQFRSVSTDTRTLQPGDLFFALRGPNHDGHTHVADAFAKGALAAVVERALPEAGPQIVVPDVLTALGDLAAAWRLTLRGRVIAVAGSVGKTTTKEMVAQLLSGSGKVHRAAGSFNNFIGLPLTLLGASPTSDFIVLEVGTNHPGEVERLAAIARPDIAVVTTIAAEHLEGLGSMEGVAAEEASLLRHLQSGGTAVLNADADLLWSHVDLPAERIVRFGASERADLRVAGLESGVEGVRFTLGRQPVALPILGAWNAANAAAACAVGLLCGVTLKESASRLAGFRAPKMRMERLEIAGVSIINDAYNSSPESARQAVVEFDRMPGLRKIAIIGDMKELGRESTRYHEELGRTLSTAAVGVVIAIGPECVNLAAACDRPIKHFLTADEARDFIVDTVRSGDLVLLKGSRAMGLEKVVKFIADKMTQTRPRVAV